LLFGSKIQGTQILADLVRECAPDFLVLFSALSASMGFVGQSVYAAANNYLDAFAQAHPQLGRTRVLSLASGAWRETGMAFRATRAALHPSRAELAAALLAQGLATAEGVSGVALALANPGPLLALSPQDPGLLAHAYGAIEAGAGPRGERHARPDLSTPYEAPVTELEGIVAAVMGECLGLDSVGRRDNFFDLGGDSLSILEIKTRLESRLGRSLDLSLFVGSVSVAELGALLSRPAGPGESCVLLREGGAGPIAPLLCAPRIR
jgi:phthiocerol/phenolphthiocerol synthesis type-I polyketide synthase E